MDMLGILQGSFFHQVIDNRLSSKNIKSKLLRRFYRLRDPFSRLIPKDYLFRQIHLRREKPNVANTLMKDVLEL